MDEARGVFLHVAGIAEPINVIAVLFGNELRWFEPQYIHVILGFVLYSQILKLCSNTSIM